MKHSRRVARVLVLPHIVLLCISGASCAQRSAELSFTLKQVGPNVWAAISNPKSKAPAGANTGFVIGDDSVAIIDATASVDADGDFDNEPAKQLLGEIRKLTKLPVKFVINTHHHLDHVAGNDIFTGAEVVAQRNVRGWIHSENLRMFGKDIKPQQKAFVDALVPPTATYDQQLDLYLGSREIRLRSFPGHTGGDSVVLIPDAKVVFTGDLFWRNMLPNLMDASTQPWINTLDTLLIEHDSGYTFVPGHGDIGNASDVAAFKDYLTMLRKLVAAAKAQGKSGDAMAEMVIPALTEKYRQWDSFESLAKENALQTDSELSGKKRVPQVQVTR